MNLTNFVQTGGFPVKSERLQEIQSAFSIFNSLGALAGDLTIISGCNISGTSVGNGVVYINGEVLDFKGAFISESIIIIQEESAKEFKNGEVKAVHYVRYATFGTNLEASWLWSDFKRPFETKNIPSDLLTKLAAIGNKEEKTVVTALAQEVENLKNSIPKIKIVNSIATVNNRTLGYKQDDYSTNYVDVYPPSGYNMSHLNGFMASIAQIEFSGDVNSDDTLWCKHSVDSSKIRIICANSETRQPSKVNYMAIWIKY